MVVEGKHARRWKDMLDTQLDDVLIAVRGIAAGAAHLQGRCDEQRTQLNTTNATMGTLHAEIGVLRYQVQKLESEKHDLQF